MRAQIFVGLSLLVLVTSFGAEASKGPSAGQFAASGGSDALAPLDELLMKKCAAFTKTDCGRRATPARARLLERLDENARHGKTPQDARRDASAGVFI